MVVVDNAAFWNAVFDLSGKAVAVNPLFIGAVFVAMLAVLVLLVNLTAFRYVFKPLLILILLTAAMAGYYMREYGVIFDKTMVTNMFLTDRAEVMELMLSPGILLHTLVFGVLPSLVVWRVRLVDQSWTAALATQGLVMLGSLAVIGLVAFVQYKNIVIVYRENRDMLCQVNPVCPLVSVTKYLYRLNRKPVPLQAIAEDAVLTVPVNGRKKNVVVMVVGETARAANFSLNDYARNTNPQMQQQAIINFSQVYSCGTSTAASLPCMFSHLGRDGADKNDPAHFENLLDILNRADVRVLWRDNDAGCKGVCTRITTDDFYTAEVPQFCREGNCFDEILLTGIEEVISRDDRDIFIVLHQKGSHGPAYYRRYPEAYRHFMPECTIVEVQDCSRQEIINSYDNTILYTDFVLSKLIHLLDKHASEYNAAMLYLSDHGESLGERGIYLHGLPYLIAPDEQIHVPMLLWLSGGYSNYMRLDPTCLTDRSQMLYSHDNLFHTVLGMFKISTHLYQKDNDIMSPCES